MTNEPTNLPIEIQVNHLRLSPKGTPTVQLYDKNKENVAVFIQEPDAKLFAEALEVFHETGMTPKELMKRISEK